MNALLRIGVMRSRTRSLAIPTERSPWVRLCTLGLLSLTVTACTPGGDGGGTIRIGIAADLKRPNMQTVLRGVELAIDQLNAEGSGRRFEIVKPPPPVTGAVEIAASLRDDPSVVAVVGPADSRSSREAAPIFSDEDGGGAVLERNPHLADMNEWRAYAGIVKATRPEIVLFPGSSADLAGFVRSLRAIGADTPVLGGDAVSELEAQATEFAGVRYVAFFQASHVHTAEAKAFVSAFTRRYGVPPEQRSALAYDATMLIGRAVLDAGAHRGRVRDYLASVGSSRPAVTGVTGSIAFDEQRDVVNKPVVIATVGR